jgi:hypothetical protein
MPSTLLRTDSRDCVPSHLTISKGKATKERHITSPQSLHARITKKSRAQWHDFLRRPWKNSRASSFAHHPSRLRPTTTEVVPWARCARPTNRSLRGVAVLFFIAEENAMDGKMRGLQFSERREVTISVVTTSTGLHCVGVSSAP